MSKTENNHGKTPMPDPEFVERRIRECKTAIDSDVRELREDMQKLHSRVDELAADVHRITIAVGDISSSLRVIAESMSKLSDLPIVWDRVKSFWVVTSWIQKNFLPLSVLIVLLALAASNGGVVDLVKGFLP